jgi:hypothetical protein
MLTVTIIKPLQKTFAFSYTESLFRIRCFLFPVRVFKNQVQVFSKTSPDFFRIRDFLESGFSSSPSPGPSWVSKYAEAMSALKVSKYQSNQTYTYSHYFLPPKILHIIKQSKNWKWYIYKVTSALTEYSAICYARLQYHSLRAMRQNNNSPSSLCGFKKVVNITWSRYIEMINFINDHIIVFAYGHNPKTILPSISCLPGCWQGL